MSIRSYAKLENGASIELPEIKQTLLISHKSLSLALAAAVRAGLSAKLNEMREKNIARRKKPKTVRLRPNGFTKLYRSSNL